MRINSIIQLISLFLSGLFILIALNKAVFTHTHICDQNRVITHSHPYDKTGESDATKKHGHSRIFLVLIANFESLILIFLLHNIKIESFAASFRFNFFPVSHSLLQFNRKESGRAPPMAHLY